MNASLPPRLEDVILKCLEKDPALRYQSARELSIDLQRLSAPSSVTSIPPARSRKFRRGFAIAGALAAILVLAWVAITMMRAPKTSSGPRLSTGALPSKNREANEYFERGMLFMISQSDLPRARQMMERALAIDPQFAAAQAEF